MRVKKAESDLVYFVTVDLGEDLLSSVLQFAQEEGIQAGEIHGIGALRDFELGYYQLLKKEYKRQRYPEVAELISCTGNLALREEKPFAHVHVAVGLPDFTVVGGHLFSGIVAVTAEMIIRPFPVINRSYDQTTGLFLLDLPLRKTT